MRSDGKPDPRQSPARMTVVECVYHMSQDSQPKGVESRFSRQLESDEQVYSRKMKVTYEWQYVDLGWVGDVGVGMLCVANEDKQNIVELSYYGDPEWIIPPGESFRGMPADAKKLRIRCQGDEAKCVVTVIPN